MILQQMLTTGERYTLTAVAWGVAILMVSPRIWRRFQKDPGETRGDLWYNVLIVFLFVLGVLVISGRIEALVLLLETAKGYIPGGG